MKKKHIFLTLCIVSSVICYICTIRDISFFISNNPSDSRSQFICAVSQWIQKHVDSTEFSSRRDCIPRTMAALPQNHHDNESGDAQGCTIPTMEPFHESIRHIYTKLPPVRCPGKPPLTYVRKRTVFVNQTALKQNYSNDLSFCLYQSITRRKGSDDHYSISQGIRFVSSIRARNEFLRIGCFDNGNNTIDKNYHVIFFRKKPKSSSYNANTTADRAGRFSLLLLGIDSVSRMNNIRQFTKTRSLLEAMEAVELTGYNKVADNTFVNIVPPFDRRDCRSFGISRYWTSHQKAHGLYASDMEKFLPLGLSHSFHRRLTLFRHIQLLEKGLHSTTNGLLPAGSCISHRARSWCTGPYIE